MSLAPGKLTTAAEAIEYLYELRLFGTKLGLENPRRLAAHFGNPHESLNFIHVAGTNGKGSVCAMLESIYRAAGYRVGLFTSPHLIEFGERIQVNRAPLEAHRLVELVNRVRDALSTLPEKHHPTFFEIVVVLGLLQFQQEHCDLVIWETGMGGRLDATNIITPRLSLITNVALDHQKWLGDTLEAIAQEKGGIIKPDVPLVHGLPPGKPRQTIESIATQHNSPIQAVESGEIDSILEDKIVGLPGRHQRINAALATRAVNTLHAHFPVAAETIASGLAQIHWPARLQRIHRPTQEIVIDGSHNEASIAALCDYLEEQWPDQPKAFLLGVLEDKGIEQWLPRLVSLAERFYLTPVASGRSLNTEFLAQLITATDERVPVCAFASVSQALERAVDRSPLLIVCGSVYLAGEALGVLSDSKLDPTQSALNDWGSSPSSTTATAPKHSDPTKP